MRPTAAASGRLVDPEGKAIPGREFSYGILVHLGKTRSGPFSWHFGGAFATSEAGEFRLAGLVVGQRYEIYTDDDKSGRVFVAKSKITPANPGPMALGDVVIDLNPPEPKPYVPPTPAERARDSFAARKEKSPREKLAYTLDEARREYTRPLLLFGGPRDPACIDLFRLFEERPKDADAAKDPARPKSPAELRWEFELASLDRAEAGVEALAKELGIAPGDARAPVLAILSEDGQLAATYPLTLGADGRLDSRALGALLGEHKRPSRDAERLLADGLARARAEDKRVFLIMSASWCGPCRLLARYLAAHKAELGRHYVFVKLDVSRDLNADALKLRYEGKDAANGVPWYVILDASGTPLVTSNAEALEEDYGTTNVGFPSSEVGINHFLKMLEQTAPRLSAEALAALRRGLNAHP